MLEDIQQHLDHFLQANPHGVMIIWGATATGKTGLSLELAKQFPLEIISADSRQIYKYMDIGTDKISLEARNNIPHHMIDIVDPRETYTAGQWKAQVQEIIPHIQQRGNLPLVVGGTGLYIDMFYKNFSMPEVAPDMIRREHMMQQEIEKPGYLLEVLEKIDPEEAMKHHRNSTRYILRALEIYTKTGQTKTELAKELPVERPLLMLGLRREKEDTNKRINARIKDMLSGGLIEEVQGLLDQGYTLDHTAMNGIGYKEIVGYLQGSYNIEKAEELLKRNTHRYAKRQRSRFRRYRAHAKQTPKDNVTYLLYELSN